MKKLRNNIYLSSIILFGVGSILHFAYEFTNENYLVGLFTPVNESIFEHLKLAFYPLLVWWIIFYILKKTKYSIDKSKWFYSACYSITTAILTILAIHYFVRYGIGKEIVFIDISSLFIGILLGQLKGYHIYKKTNFSKFNLACILLVIYTLAFLTLTIFPPKIPLFEDQETHTYGINNSK